MEFSPTATIKLEMLFVASSPRPPNRFVSCFAVLTGQRCPKQAGYTPRHHSQVGTYRDAILNSGHCLAGNADRGFAAGCAISTCSACPTSLSAHPLHRPPCRSPFASSIRTCEGDQIALEPSPHPWLNLVRCPSMVAVLEMLMTRPSLTRISP
jgi:hypothetical protein